MSMVHLLSCFIFKTRSGYGQTGPFKSAAGYDVVIEGEAGLMHMSVDSLLLELESIGTTDTLLCIARENQMVLLAKSELLRLILLQVYMRMERSWRRLSRGNKLGEVYGSIATFSKHRLVKAAERTTRCDYL